MCLTINVEKVNQTLIEGKAIPAFHMNKGDKAGNGVESSLKKNQQIKKRNNNVTSCLAKLCLSEVFSWLPWGFGFGERTPESKMPFPPVAPGDR